MLIKDKTRRKGIKDIWNSFMCEGAKFSINDIPYTPTTATKIPTNIITWVEAKSLYKKYSKDIPDFHESSFVCFYIDDDKFDGPKGIWNKSEEALTILSHFDGVITPDFSTYNDFPEPIKIYATYRMRLFGYWLGTKGISVINNVRWGTRETYRYCFDGIDSNSIIAISTCGGNPHTLANRERFNSGIYEIERRLHPHTIIVYGSDKYPCFKELESHGVKIISFKSQMAKAYEARSTT